jgi:hypothetical protein
MHERRRTTRVRIALVGLGLAAGAAACGAAPTAPSNQPPAQPATARYVVTFNSTWSASTHPTDFPADAHYSGLIGGTHRPSVVFWREGGVATEGIRAMAERGRQTPLDQEVMSAISTGHAERVLYGNALGTTPGQLTLEFEISQNFPLVTLVTMVAPSPDWFAGVSGLALFENGSWRDDVRADLFAYDAGTDSGVTYQAADLETTPRQAITRISGYPMLNGGQVLAFGTFTFRRMQ